MVMKQYASLAAGIFLILAAVAQLLRFVFNITIIADGIDIPGWMSLVAAVFLGALAFLLLKERHQLQRQNKM